MIPNVQSSNPFQEMELSAYSELLRQSRQTFNFHVIAATASIGLTVACGGTLAVTGNPVQGLAAGGVGSGVAYTLYQAAQNSSKETEKKMAKLIKELKLRSQPKDGGTES